jgi:SAM-dependent methyltransferase
VRDGYYSDPRVAAAYDAEHAGDDITRDDIPFYVGLAREAAAGGHSVLELGCGTGRVTLPIACAGVRVTGLDSSAEMLAVARGRALDAMNPRWVLADMASFQLDERFGLVIIPFRSFLLLLTVEEQESCLRCVRDHLVDGGRLAFNIFNPRVAEEMARMAVEPKARERIRRRGDDGARSREAHRSGGSAVIARPERNLRLRHVHRCEMERLLNAAGFGMEGLHGWFDRRPFEDASGEMVFVARRFHAVSKIWNRNG